MVQQEPTLFACSIKENIAYGKCATDEEVRIETNHECDMRGHRGTVGKSARL